MSKFIHVSIRKGSKVGQSGEFMIIAHPKHAPRWVNLETGEQGLLDGVEQGEDGVFRAKGIS